MPQRNTLILLFAAVIGLAATKPAVIDLQVSPRVASGPTTVTTTITIETHYQNSALCLDWESDIGSAGSHCWTIEGQFAPHQQTYDLKNLPEGHYTIVAQVYRAPVWYDSEPVNITID